MHPYIDLFPAEPLQEPIESVPIGRTFGPRDWIWLFHSARIHLLCAIRHRTKEVVCSAQTEDRPTFDHPFLL